MTYFDKRKQQRITRNLVFFRKEAPIPANDSPLGVDPIQRRLYGTARIHPEISGA